MPQSISPSGEDTHKIDSSADFLSDNPVVNALLNESLAELEFKSVLEKVAKYAVSEPGKDIILRLKPSEDIDFINSELSAVSEMTALLINDDPVPFEGFHDARPQFAKSLIINSILTATDLLNVRDTIRVFRLMKNYFSARAEKYPDLHLMSQSLRDSIMIEKHIAEAIDETGEVRENASKDLARIRRAIFDKSAHLRNRLQKILQKVAEDDMIMEEFSTVREDRFVIPVKSEYKRKIPGIIHGVSQTGQTVFLEPSEIFELNNDVSLLKNEEQREVYRILANLTAEIGVEARDFLESLAVTARLDSVLARARYALDYGGVKPEVGTRTEIYMRNVKHPLLAVSKGVKKVIPLSVEFNPKQRGHLISGPNAGGKTVALKCIGLSVAMALSGIFPLGEVKTDYRMIFCSIGDHQSIENDLSTFSSEIIKMRDIISACSPDSLVLIDEIGSGTDPQEGAALSAAILDTFINVNLFFVATTHQSALKSYALNRPEIENASLEFDRDKLQPTYKFLEGVPGNSYAFILAETLGIPRHIIDRAAEYVGTRQTELEESIAVLQQYKNEAEKLRREAAAEKLKAETARIDYEKQFKELKQKKNEIVTSAREEALRIVAESNALVENTIREIREQSKPVAEIKKTFNDTKAELEQQVEKLAPKQDAGSTPTELSAGDRVTMDDDPTVGTVISADNKALTALVEFGGLKFRLPFKRLKPTQKKSAAPRSEPTMIDLSAFSRIDLRGKRAEESIREIDTAISDALMSNIPVITIIHGKGTGALRVAVHRFLDEHPSVVSFRLGDLVEGGSGVTIVEL